jgi:transposase-like protein
MYCPRCGTFVEDGVFMCKRCGFHFDEPFSAQARSGHSLLWWLVVLTVVGVGSSMLMALLLYLMVMGI